MAGGTGIIDAAVRLVDDTVIAALVAGFLASVVVGAVLARRTKVSPILAALTVFAAVSVAVATLQMGRAGGGILDRDPFEHLSLATLGHCLVVADGGSMLSTNETRLNLLLYMPFAVLATLTFGRPWRTLAWSVALILTLEALQSVLDVGVCSTSDIGYDIAGAAIAIIATVIVQRTARHLRERAGPSEPG